MPQLVAYQMLFIYSNLPVSTGGWSGGETDNYKLYIGVQILKDNVSDRDNNWIS